VRSLHFNTLIFGYNYFTILNLSNKLEKFKKCTLEKENKTPVVNTDSLDLELKL